MCHGLLHDAGRLDDLGQEHAATAEAVADDVHARHERALDDIQRARGRQASFLGILHDPVGDALHEGVPEPLIHGRLAPGQVADRAGGGAAGLVGDLEQALRGVRSPVEHEVLHAFAEVRVEVVQHGQGSGVHDGHVQPGPDGVVQEDGVDGLAHGVVAAERERDVGDAAAGEDAGQLRLEAAHGLDEGHRVAGVLLDAGADGEDVGVDDDVLGLEAGLPR